MYLYVNGFRCAANTRKTEIAIKFTQDVPSFLEDGTCGSAREDVTSVVMTNETATKLALALQEVQDKAKEPEE